MEIAPVYATARALTPGDTVAVVAPSGAVDQDRVAQCTALLEELGFRPLIDPAITNRRGYLAGTSDEATAYAFSQAFADPSVSAVICARGGYGCMRILPFIDWSVIKANPKFFCGFSDITGLHLAIHQECELVTFHGGPLPRTLSTDKGNEWNARSFLTAITSSEPLGTIELPPEGTPVETIIPGNAEGILEGGNLTLLGSLCGTRWQPDLNGRLLLVEDINEAPYRVDRTLTQLHLSGVFDGVRGIIFGDSTSCEKLADEDGLTFKQVIEERLGILGVPVIYGFPCGHTDYRATLPLGLPAKLDADARTLTFPKSALNPAALDDTLGAPASSRH